MNLLQKIKNKITIAFRRDVMRDHFLLEIRRWFRDNSDGLHRLDYPLDHDSIVFDLGGYHGDFAEAVYKKFGCKVFIFEPVPDFHLKCVERFRGNRNIHCLNYGLSSSDGFLDISLAENASSFALNKKQGLTKRVQVRSIVDCIKELGIDRIDLIKINIEGGEFDVLPAIIQSGDITKIKYLQIQFHNFIVNAFQRREDIRVGLAITHDEMWNYDFVWESWKIKAGE